MKTLRATSLFVYEWGVQGDPAVLYWDGVGGTGLHANELAPKLVADHGLRVVAPDAPGHGRSPAQPADAYRPSRLAEAAARLLDELGIERVHFVGFSWGGRVGCSFAALFPSGARPSRWSRAASSSRRGLSTSKELEGRLVLELGGFLRLRAGVAAPLDARRGRGARGHHA